LSLSGGKDSTALALYMRDRVSEMEYVFCDTKKELPETYEYLKRLEALLGKPIEHLHDERGFDHWLNVYGGYLPSSRMRWCTRQLKIRPFERYVGNDEVISYIGIRADEDRGGYISTKPNIKARYPFKEDGITKRDVIRILEEHGLGLPDYYRWRTRSGCYFCFFQRKIEWVGLKENHPDLFELAKGYEKVEPGSTDRYTWAQGESLEELEQHKRVEEIRRNQARSADTSRNSPSNQSLYEIFGDEDDDDEQACLICQL
jgi:3'-phosphoadenosine 5'-phosphosulfate sulfotransferase (PAPS reductase)/FAD synthetase